jgi:predicted nucleic acid-binding protein
MAAAKYVFDTSALMALLNGEPEGPAVAAIVRAADSGKAEVALPFIALMETEYLLLRILPADEVETYMALLDSWPATSYESSEEWRRLAARVKAAGDISVSDAWIAALALLLDAEVLHKDAQFAHVSGLRQRDLRKVAPRA